MGCKNHVHIRYYLFYFWIRISVECRERCLPNYMTVNGLKIYGEIPYLTMLFSDPLLCFFLSLLPIKFRIYIPQKPCNAQIVILVSYSQESSVAQLVAHSWNKGLDAWFESRQNHAVFSHHISPCRATFFLTLGRIFS